MVSEVSQEFSQGNHYSYFSGHLQKQKDDTDYQIAFIFDIHIFLNLGSVKPIHPRFKDAHGPYITNFNNK